MILELCFKDKTPDVWIIQAHLDTLRNLTNKVGVDIYCLHKISVYPDYLNIIRPNREDLRTVTLSFSSFNELVLSSVFDACYWLTT